MKKKIEMISEEQWVQRETRRQKRADRSAVILAALVGSGNQTTNVVRLAVDYASQIELRMVELELQAAGGKRNAK